MNRSNFWITLGSAVALAGMAMWFFLTHEQVSREQRQPPRGPARVNPLYALEKTLNQVGYRAESYPRLDVQSLKLASNDTVILYGDPRAIPQNQIADLLQWLAQGGQLVFEVSRTASKSSTLNEAFGLISSGDNEAVFDWLKLGWKCENLKLPAQTPTLFCGPAFNRSSAELTRAIGDDDNGYLYAQLRYGEGTVTALSQMRFLTNFMFEEAENHQIAAYLLPMANGDAKAHLIYSTDIDSLLTLIWRHGWMLLIGLALAIAAWIALRSRRLGPLLPLPSENRRALMEHIHAAGQFAFRRDHGQQLHRSMRDAVLERLHRRHPLGIVDDATLARTLAERVDIDLARIERALAPLPPHSTEAFREVIQTLIEVRNRL